MACLNFYLVPSFVVQASTQQTYRTFCRYTPLIFYHFLLISYVYINIHEYLNEIIRIFNHFSQVALSQFLFGTKFCRIRYLAAGVVVIL